MGRLKNLCESNRIYDLLRRIRKRRTLPLKIAFPILIAEDILTGKKPHELLPGEGITTEAIIGFVLVLAGCSLRFWARGHFEKGRLFTTGPYALVRHPLYVGSFLIVCGVLSQLNDWINWVIVIPLFAIFYGASIVYEERNLERRFGRQWRLYRAKVNAFVPSLRTHVLRPELHNWQWKVFLATGELFTTTMVSTLPITIELLEEIFFERSLC